MVNVIAVHDDIRWWRFRLQRVPMTASDTNTYAKTSMDAIKCYCDYLRIIILRHTSSSVTCILSWKRNFYRKHRLHTRTSDVGTLDYRIRKNIKLVSTYFLRQENLALEQIAQRWCSYRYYIQNTHRYVLSVSSAVVSHVLSLKSLNFCQSKYVLQFIFNKLPESFEC